MALDAKSYAAIEMLRDGRELTIRALKPDDRTDLLAAVGKMSPQSLQRRFFSAKRHFSEEEIAYFGEVDFVRHVALVAEAREEGRDLIVGGARYIVVRPEAAEIAFAVIDQYQGKGIGASLMRHLVKLARDAGLKELFAEVLSENVAMMSVFEKSGLSPKVKHVGQVLHVTFELS
jgi:GNAT superfamily N-acetyltransferase